MELLDHPVTKRPILQCRYVSLGLKNVHKRSIFYSHKTERSDTFIPGVTTVIALKMFVKQMEFALHQ